MYVMVRKYRISGEEKQASLMKLKIKKAPGYTAEQIKYLRERYHISQAVLTVVLNTSLSTIL
jgi:DNA-binding transcriptional regulator YiaG